MSLNRETIFAAAFARLETITSFRITSRVFQSWDDTPPQECPAMFFTKGPEDFLQVTGMPPQVRMTGLCAIYARNDADPDAPASTQLNDILDALNAALEFKPTEGQIVGAQFVANPYAGWGTTLGGLVAYCRATSADIYEGVIGGGAVALVTIEMLATQ